MSPSEIKAWRVNESKKRKALKQREYRVIKKKLLKDLQSRSTELRSIQVKILGKNEGSESTKDSDADAGNVRVVKEENGTNMASGKTSWNDDCKLGSKEHIEGANIVRTSINNGVIDGNSHHDVGEVKILGTNQAPARLSEAADSPARIVTGNDLYKIADDRDTHEHGHEYDFDLLIEKIAKVEGVHVPTEEFDRLFYPVDINEEDDDCDISVIGDSSLDYQLLLQFYCNS